MIQRGGGHCVDLQEQKVWEHVTGAESVPVHAGGAESAEGRHMVWATTACFHNDGVELVTVLTAIEPGSTTWLDSNGRRGNKDGLLLPVFDIMNHVMGLRAWGYR